MPVLGIAVVELIRLVIGPRHFQLTIQSEFQVKPWPSTSKPESPTPKPEIPEGLKNSDRLLILTLIQEPYSILFGSLITRAYFLGFGFLVYSFPRLQGLGRRRILRHPKSAAT